MRKLFSFAVVCFVLLMVSSIAIADEGDKIEKSWIWLGGHYTEFDDQYMTKKVGEYNLGENEWLPEFKLGYFSQQGGTIFRAYGHYYDKNNAYGKVISTFGDRFRIKSQYRSLIKQEAQDLMGNLEAREYLPVAGTPGGKMVTHEITDPNADYNIHRQEILTELSVLLAKKNNVRLELAHRTILKSGHEQKISSTHCFSCHMTSSTQRVDNQQHQVEMGLDGELGNFDVGYRFGYRKYLSKINDPIAYYDDARHPVNGGSGGEFGPRLIYEDEYLPYSTLPETEKYTHKVRVKGDVGKGRLSGAFTYSKAKNNKNDLAIDAYSGTLNYAVAVNNKTRIITKGSTVKQAADSIYIDLPTYRANAGDGNSKDFDYTRYSHYDRTVMKLSAELINKLKPNMTLSLLGGFDITDRDNYPQPYVNTGLAEGFEIAGKEYNLEPTSTKKFYAQLKLRMRKGLKYSSTIKYRFEKISDPFYNAKGLFEASGASVLDPQTPATRFVFYWQREDLRYQNITSFPTQVHKFSWNSNWNPKKEISVNMGVNGQIDKNSDLDSLDVEHFMLVPNVNVNIMPDDKLMFSGGYTYNYYKSRGPVTVALFDG